MSRILFFCIFGSSVADPGYLFRILIFPSPIQDQEKIPDPGSGSASKNLSIFDPKISFYSLWNLIRDLHPRSGSRIRNFIFSHPGSRTRLNSSLILKWKQSLNQSVPTNQKNPVICKTPSSSRSMSWNHSCGFLFITYEPLIRIQHKKIIYSGSEFLDLECRILQNNCFISIGKLNVFP